MTNTEAKMLAKQWVLGNRNRKASLTRKYDLKQASSSNTGRLKMGIRIDVENNPKDYKAALDDDGSLVFFTGKPIKRVPARQLFTPPKARKEAVAEAKIDRRLAVCKIILKDHDDQLVEQFSSTHEFDINEVSAITLKKQFASYVTSITERTEYQLVAQKTDGTELKSKFYEKEEDLAELRRKCEESDDYESTMVVKRVVDTDEDKDEVEEGAPSRDELYKLTDQALRQVPGSAAQQEVIKQLNVVREKLGMKKLVEKETISDSLIETTLDFANYTIDSLTPVIEEDFETPMKIDARRKVFRQKAARLGYKKVKEDGHADVASALGQIGIVRAALEKMTDHLSTMNKEDDLPTWLTNKIATATDRLDTAADYLGSRKEVQESTKSEASLVNIKNEIETIKQRMAQAAKNKQNKEVAKLKKTLKSLEKKKKMALNASTDLEEASWNKTEKLPLTPAEKKIIGDTGVYKEKYKLDRTQSNYRASRTSFSMPFTGKEDLPKLKKLVSRLKESVELAEAKMNYVIYDKKTKEVYASSSKPFDKFKMDDVADDMKVKKSDLVMKKMRKSQKAGERLKEANIEEKKIAGLVKKADKSGIPYGILKQVYNRGMAAWKTGHRPGTTPQQWAFARVNSFVTKSKGTWGGADKDLAAKARKAKK